MKKLFLGKAGRMATLVCFCALLFTSCSNSEYLYSIPSTATALVKIDASRMDADRASSVLHALLPVGDAASSGLDFKSNVYAFETVDGNFGLCAKVKDSGDLADAINSMADRGRCSKVRKQGKYSFSDVCNAWSVGFSDDALVVLGPVSAASLPDAQRSVARMLRQDEDASIVTRPMYERIDTMSASVAMVAQVQALPEKFVAPFTIGAPKDADASQVLVAAGFSMNNGVVRMDGEMFSFNKNIDAQLKKSAAVYRKIDGHFAQRMPQGSLLGLFTNVDGKKFLPLLQANRSLQALLAGLNTAIDLDNILRSVDGDLAVLSSGIASDNVNLTMFADVKSPVWTADVDYWKQSCPAGSSISGNDGNWSYNSGDTRFAFGLLGNEFYGTTDAALNPVLNKGHYPAAVNSDVANMVRGNRLVMVLNVGQIVSGGSLPGGMGALLKPLLGDVKAVVYVMK